MKKYMVIIVIFYYNFASSQPLTNFSKTFQEAEKNIPLTIVTINNSFYVLRYNKAVHDFVIEKRSRSGGQMLFFKTLKLDSVCADWFDYENLDYLFFESNHKLILVFEKDLKTKKTIYFKTIDTLGHVSGFKELAALEWNSSIYKNQFLFKRTSGGDLLIVGTTTFMNGTVQKTAVLFDVMRSVPIWIKRLPDEMATSVVTNLFEANENKDLYFTRYNLVTITDTSGKSTLYDTLSVCKILSSEKKPVSHNVLVPANYEFNDAILIPVKNDVVFFASGAQREIEDKNKLSNGVFVCERFNEDLSKMIYGSVTPYDTATQKMLTYFDGNDFKDPGFKPFAFSDHILSGNELVLLMENREREFYKSILALKTDVETGIINWLHVIPRKVFFFPKRVLYRNIGCYKASYLNGTLSLYFLENPANLKLNVRTIPYNKYIKQTNYWGCNTVRVKIQSNGDISKELFFHDQNYDLIPLKNSGLAEGVPAMFYLTNSRSEKFGFE